MDIRDRDYGSAQRLAHREDVAPRTWSGLEVNEYLLSNGFTQQQINGMDKMTMRKTLDRLKMADYRIMLLNDITAAGFDNSMYLDYLPYGLEPIVQEAVDTAFWRKLYPEITGKQVDPQWRSSEITRELRRDGYDPVAIEKRYPRRIVAENIMRQDRYNYLHHRGCDRARSHLLVDMSTVEERDRMLVALGYRLQDISPDDRYRTLDHLIDTIDASLVVGMCQTISANRDSTRAEEGG